MLFHPFEKQFYFPAFFVQQCYFQSGQAGVVGQENKFLILLLIIVLYPTKFIWVFFLRIIGLQPSYLVIANTFTFIYRVRVHAFESHVIFRSGNEEGTLFMQTI